MITLNLFFLICCCCLQTFFTAFFIENWNANLSQWCCHNQILSPINECNPLKCLNIQIMNTLKKSSNSTQYNSMESFQFNLKYCKYYSIWCTKCTQNSSEIIFLQRVALAMLFFIFFLSLFDPANCLKFWKHCNFKADEQECFPM